MTTRPAFVALMIVLGTAGAAPVAAEDAGLRRLCGIVLRHLAVDHPIRFEPSSARLPGTAEALIDELANLLTECPGALLHVDGHTDDRGDPARNKSLSEARAPGHRLRRHAAAGR